MHVCVCAFMCVVWSYLLVQSIYLSIYPLYSHHNLNYLFFTLPKSVSFGGTYTKKRQHRKSQPEEKKLLSLFLLLLLLCVCVCVFSFLFLSQQNKLNNNKRLLSSFSYGFRDGIEKRKEKKRKPPPLPTTQGFSSFFFFFFFFFFGLTGHNTQHSGQL